MHQQQFQHQYQSLSGTWDEMCEEKNIRKHYAKVFDALQSLNISALQQKEKIAGELFMNQGITFTVYSDNEGIERIFPFDIIPRIITGTEWSIIEKGLQQRLKALNLFFKRYLFRATNNKRWYYTLCINCFLSALHTRGIWHTSAA